MREAYKLTNIEFADLSLMALDMRGAGARLSQICSVRTKTGFDLLYSFVKDYEFINYKVTIDEDTEIESITAIFPNAFLYENEMSELFGIKIKYIALDYKNKLYDIAVETPFK